MDDNKVLISVKGTQQYEKNNDDIIELITEGKYYKKGNKYFVTYEETEITGMKGTTTTIKMEGEKVTLLRFGENNSQLIFEQGQKHLCHYETIQGAFTVGVFSNNVNVNIDEQGGQVSVDYNLQIDNSHSSKNDFVLNITKI
jgi:uncharacterized beta-barrel protein YwiB (DUF1934 family)